MTPAERIAEIADRQRRREERANKPWNRRRARGKEIDDAVRAARAIDQRLPEESDKDHAKRLGLLGEARTVGGPLFGCAWCADLPHRRHPDGCRGCGQPFEPEAVEHAVPDVQSSAGIWIK